MVSVPLFGPGFVALLDDLYCTVCAIALASTIAACKRKNPHLSPTRVQ
jgi:hypothetical protein